MSEEGEGGGRREEGGVIPVITCAPHGDLAGDCTDEEGDRRESAADRIQMELRWDSDHMMGFRWELGCAMVEC